MIIGAIKIVQLLCGAITAFYCGRSLARITKTFMWDVIDLLGAMLMFGCLMLGLSLIVLAIVA